MWPFPLHWDPVRIIAGQHRGRKLLPPATETTRPVTDRVKQSLFDILSPRIDGSNVYDCFAGTGSMGLECLSRGATQITFFEADRSALDRLRKNIAPIDPDGCCKIVPGDLFRWFENTAPAEADRADLIFLDPPYCYLRERAPDLTKLVETIARQHLRPDGIVIFRHDAADSLDLPPLNVFDQRDYGGMTLKFLSGTPSTDQRQGE